MLATAATVLTMCYIIHLFVTNYGTYHQFAGLECGWNTLSTRLTPATDFNWYPLLNTLTTLTVAVFYTERAYRLYKSRWIIALVAPLMYA